MNASSKIVGIGASAGGLKAISEFFDHIPNNSGMVYVVIQHLSPDFKSMMSELLLKHTKMPIHVVDKPTNIAVNSIYLISSHFNVILKKGMLQPIKRSDPHSINLPINQFFESLGNEKKENAVGIILSGTGSDGSSGIKVIKSQGGLVMIEDPQYAQFDGMPVAAIKSGVADSILPPYALARELMQLCKGEKKNNDFLIINLDDPNFDSTFKAILEEVYNKTGINFSDYKNSTLIRRMEKRMFITNQHDLEAYLKYLRLDKEEVYTLQKEFLINVTHFFRDKPAFDLLKAQIIPKILEQKGPNDQIRIWISACSTGQEALSIGILITEYFEKNNHRNPVKIFASDIDKNAIAVASEALYTAESLRDMPANYLEKYFDPVDNHKSFRVAKSLREKIVYAVHDAIYDPPFINLDMISCRNMMIYLNTKNQKLLLSNFHFSLNLGGMLFLGPSESIGEFKSAYKTLNSKWNLFQNIKEQKFNPVRFSQTGSDKMKRSSVMMTSAASIADQAKVLRNSVLNDKTYIKLLVKAFAPTCLVVNDQLDILISNGNVDKILKFPNVSSDFNLKEMVGSDELIMLKNGIQKCSNSEKIAVYKKMVFRKNEDKFLIDVHFRCIPMTNHIFENVYIIELFFASKEESKKLVEVVPEDEFSKEKISTLEKELSKVQYEKQVLIQQLETANEELQASNEELLAANEELQSTNEELQSVNEELYTVNTELQNKVNQLIVTTNDLDNLLNSTEIGSVFLDRALNIRRFTPAIKEQFDLLESDVGRSITSFTSSFVDKSIYVEIEKVVNQLGIYEKEIKDDKDNYYLLRVLPYKTDEGNIDGAVLTFIPINELKRAHDNLEEAGEKYRAVFENSYDSIILIDEFGKVNSCNYDFEGFSKSEIVGKPALKIMPLEYRKILQQAMTEVYNGESSSFFDYESEVGDSSKQYFSATITPVIVREKIICLAFITRNITELKVKELELREMSIHLEKQVVERSAQLEVRNNELSEMNSYLDSFVHGAAHDLRAPITQIQGMMRLVPKVAAVEKKEEMFGEVAICVKRLEKTLNGLIEMIDFQKNNNRISQPINLLDSFNGVKDQLEKDILDANAKISIDISKKYVVNFIPAYITSIFYNLLSNAIKYRSYDNNLHILISAKQADGFTVITVVDNGIGIDLDRYGHFLFQPFKRLTVEREGTGIGLSIINSVVKKNGGRIEVESKLNKGTTFSVFIKPLATYEPSRDTAPM